MSRRLIAALSLVAVLAVVLVVVLVTRGGGDDRRIATGDPLAAALAYAPASSDVVAVLDVGPGQQQRSALNGLVQRFPAGRFAAQAVRSALGSLGLDADADVPDIVGGPVVIAGPAPALSALTSAVASLSPDLGPVLRAGAVIAVVARDAGAAQDALDGRLRALPAGGGDDTHLYALAGGAGVLALRGNDVVVAGSTRQVLAALARQGRPGGLTPATLAARLGPLSGPALLRLAARPGALLAPGARAIPYAAALRDAGLSIRVERPGLRVRARLVTDPARLTPTDLPLAPGAAPPHPAPGASPLSAGVRDVAQTIRVLDAARGKLDIGLLSGVEDALGSLDSIKGPLKTFGRIDVDGLIGQLTATTTFTTEPSGWAARAEMRDGGKLRGALDRIAAIPDFALRLSGLTDFNVAQAGRDTYEIRRAGRTTLRVMVTGNTLVITNDLNVDIAAIARRPPQTVGRPGALAFNASAAAVQDQLITRLRLPGLARLVLDGFGPLSGSVQSSTSSMDLDAMLTLGG